MNMTDVYHNFIKMAFVLSERSTCLRRHYGAIIVSPSCQIISAGFNNAPYGDTNCESLGYCMREKLNVPKGERYELCRAVHAEENAVITGDPLKMVGAVIFIAGRNVSDNSIADGSPCLMCRRVLKNAKIRQAICAVPKSDNLFEYTLKYIMLNDGLLNF